MLVAGWENWGDSRDVMRTRRSRRFFFCMHECSPSISATARLRFQGPDCGSLGKKVRFISGLGSGVVKSRVLGPSAGTSVSNGRLCIDDVSAISAGFILRRPT